MKKTILVVDDELNIRRVLERAFLKEGYHVHLAEGGHQALRILEEVPADVVLTDVVMPDMSGLELLKQIRAKHTFPRLIIKAVPRPSSLSTSIVPPWASMILLTR